MPFTSTIPIRHAKSAGPRGAALDPTHPSEASSLCHPTKVGRTAPGLTANRSFGSTRWNDRPDSPTAAVPAGDCAETRGQRQAQLSAITSPARVCVLGRRPNCWRATLARTNRENKPVSIQNLSAFQRLTSKRRTFTGWPSSGLVPLPDQAQRQLVCPDQRLGRLSGQSGELAAETLIRTRFRPRQAPDPRGRLTASNAVTGAATACSSSSNRASFTPARRTRPADAD